MTYLWAGSAIPLIGRSTGASARKTLPLQLHRRASGGDHQHAAGTAGADRFVVKVDSNHRVGAHRLLYRALLSRLRFQKNLYTFVGELKIFRLLTTAEENGFVPG